MDMQDGRIGQAYRAFFQAVRDSAGTSGIIRAASQIFNAPVLFVDQYFRVSSLYPNISIGEPMWDYAIAHKSIDRSKIWPLLDECIGKRDEFYSTFYANTGTCMQFPRIFGEVVIDGTVMGHVIIFLGGKPMEIHDLEITDILIDALYIKIQGLARGATNWNLSMSSKLRDLLSPATPPQLTRLACETLGKSMAPGYAILATPIGPLAAQRAFAQHAVLQLQQQHRNVVPLIHNDVIITLMGEVKPAPDDFYPRLEETKFVGGLFSFFREHELVSGLSGYFTQLDQVYAHYRQAVLTARLALALNAEKSAVFTDYMPLPLILSALEREPESAFVLPILGKMQDYDAAHNTEYFETLRVFSLSMHNKGQSALRLSIHKNTLLYRLDRIRELFGILYEDSAVAINILLSFLILELRRSCSPEQLDALLRHPKPGDPS